MLDFVQNRKQIRHLATKDLSPKVIAVDLTSSSLFAKDGFLFPKEAILKADAEAVKLDQSFKGAPGSVLNNPKKRSQDDGNSINVTKRRKTKPGRPGISQRYSNSDQQAPFAKTQHYQSNTWHQGTGQGGQNPVQTHPGYNITHSAPLTRDGHSLSF